MDFMTSALIASWVAICLLAFVVSALVRQVHELSRNAGGRPPSRIGLPSGSRAPDAETLVPPGRRGLLLFLTPDCRTCRDVLDEAATRAGTGATPEVRALYAGPAPHADARIPTFGERADLFERYGIVATPFAVMIDAAGRVTRSEPLGSRDALRRLLDPDPTRVGSSA
ncbi:MAG TPA: hypothetical protein VI076_15025 [Actinopolymorphaceae bacterium]